MSPRQRIMAVLTLTLAAPCALAADTLVLRNGNRVRGEVVAIRGGTIEFEEQNARGQRRTIRVDRNQVARIEFEDYGSAGGGWSGGGSWPGGGGGWPDSGGRPSGLRERTVSVSASVPWNDTGIVVRPGQDIFLEASGQVRWGRDRRDGPEGENDSPYNAGRPIPNRAAAALIGRVGDDSSDVFFIGAGRGPIRNAAGRTAVPRHQRRRPAGQLRELPRGGVVLRDQGTGGRTRCPVLQGMRCRIPVGRAFTARLRRRPVKGRATLGALFLVIDFT